MIGKLKYDDDRNKWFIETEDNKNYLVTCEVDDALLNSEVEFELEQELERATRYTLDVPTYIVTSFKPV